MIPTLSTPRAPARTSTSLSTAIAMAGPTELTRNSDGSLQAAISQGEGQELCQVFGVFDSLSIDVVCLLLFMFRLDATDMLERLRGKRLVFVGDSLNRNMWESLVCVLRNSIKERSKVFEASGRHEFRTVGSYSFVFKVVSDVPSCFSCSFSDHNAILCVHFRISIAQWSSSDLHFLSKNGTCR